MSEATTATPGRSRPNDLADLRRSFDALKGMLLMVHGPSWDLFSGLHGAQQDAYLARVSDLAHECSDIAWRLLPELETINA
jgi:hypothetical protein